MEPKGQFSERVCNFNAGPSALPLSILEQIQKDLLNWHGHGLSIMEYVIAHGDSQPVDRHGSCKWFHFHVRRCILLRLSILSRMSHRSKEFDWVLNEAISDLKKLLYAF
jgi:phosphoserine aminotransferase